MYKIYLSFNQLTSVNTLPPAQLAWCQTRSFQPAGLEEKFCERMSQTQCIFYDSWGYDRVERIFL